MNLKPYKFQPILKTVIWGGQRIAQFKGIESESALVGESWELSGLQGRESVVDGGPDHGLTLSQLIERHKSRLVGEQIYSRYGTRFPMLVKLIDARQDLSLQVHPADDMAQRLHGCNGKTEMWYVIDHAPKAQIVAGFDRAITPDECDRRVADGTIMQVVAHHRSRRGDVYFLPPGCIHSIGAGNLIAEIQQTSDVTYRVFDYDRLDDNGQQRPLHIRWAKEALDYTMMGKHVRGRRPGTAQTTKLIECEHFVVHRHRVDGQCDIDVLGTFVVVMCIGGAAQVTSARADDAPTVLRQGETILVPACTEGLRVSGGATLLVAKPTLHNP